MAEDVVYGTRSETVLMSRQGSVLSVCGGCVVFKAYCSWVIVFVDVYGSMMFHVLIVVVITIAEIDYYG